VYSNDAAHGGGLAVTASGDGQAQVQLFTADPLRPVRVHDNFASISGGAIYAKGHGGVDNFWGLVCASDFRIDDNAAPEGSAIHADNDGGLFPFGGLVYFNDPTSLCSGLPTSALRCAAGVPCNTINDNLATNAQGAATLGATLRMEESSQLRGDRFAMQGNAGGYAIRTTDGTTVSNCLLTDNQVTRQLIASASYPLELLNCTLANNSILSTDTIHAEGALTLADTIIDQPGNLAVAYSGEAGYFHADYVLSSDVSTLPAVEGVVVGRPSFVNAAQRDYHLQATSLGVDFAPPIAGDDRDLDRLPHDQDVAAGNLWGVRDLGAYERQSPCTRADTILCSGFEAL
jgi:predicted outer membrane repeat protein